MKIGLGAILLALSLAACGSEQAVVSQNPQSLTPAGTSLQACQVVAPDGSVQLLTNCNAVRGQKSFAFDE